MIIKMTQILIQNVSLKATVLPNYKNIKSHKTLMKWQLANMSLILSLKPQLVVQRAFQGLCTPVLACSGTHIQYSRLYEIKCFIHPNSSPLPPSFPFNGHANGSGHQPPLSSHIWLESFLRWTLTTLFIGGQPLTHKLITILTVVWDCHHSLNRWGGEVRRAITWIFASACLSLCPHTKSSRWPHSRESVHSGGIGAHLETRQIVVGVRESLV